MRTGAARGLRRLLAAAAVVLLAAAAWAKEIPRAPPGGSPVFDDAHLITPEDHSRIAEIHRQALADHDTPIVVVTLPYALDYGRGGVDGLARRWFDAWEIGTLRRPGGSNRGMLLLVGVHERAARIELGADWGRNSDDETARIMDVVIVPRFRDGDFSGGIADGVAALRDLARIGPYGSGTRSLAHHVRSVSRYSHFSPTMCVSLAALGVVLAVLGVWPKFRKWVLLAGVALIAVSLVTYVALVLLVIVGRVLLGGPYGGWQSRRTWWRTFSDSGSSWGSSSGGSSGGGFSGGSSGGGGASGSW